MMVKRMYMLKMPMPVLFKRLILTTGLDAVTMTYR